MNIEEQLEAARTLFIRQGLSVDEIALFEELVRGFTVKSVGLLASHFNNLLIIARENGEGTDDESKVALAIKISLNVSDVKKLNADYKIAYNRSYSQSDGDREDVTPIDPSEIQEAPAQSCACEKQTPPTDDELPLGEATEQEAGNPEGDQGLPVEPPATETPVEAQPEPAVSPATDPLPEESVGAAKDPEEKPEPVASGVGAS